jgi:pyruvate/2-oxoglutarate/acetoin dehydrogenase E1 component
MREWILANELADETELEEIEIRAKELVKHGRQDAWDKYILPVKEQVDVCVKKFNPFIGLNPIVKQISDELISNREPLRRDIMKALSTVYHITKDRGIKEYLDHLTEVNLQLFNSHLYNEGPRSALNIAEISPVYQDNAPMVNGYEILNKYFNELFATNNKVAAFGEDLGFIGDVNQGFSGLQAKYGEERIFDTGIRELSIIGQGIGMALRGLRPIAEIQYLDYLLYALQPLSDDVATTHFRTCGQQSVPLIVRTRGHRLEGIWHSGSPMGMIINSLRGIYVCVPRNMVKAAGMYNTLLQANDPGLIIECLNGYRLKEKLPSNLIAYTVPLGIPEIVRKGTDITMVTYGSTVRIVEEAAEVLEEMEISCEVVDVQTLLPFDINHKILDSLKKTNRIVFIDEDVPGGACAYMFNKVMEEQGGYRWVDVAPRTITGKDHRPSYGSDGDYFSKPNTEDVVKVALDMMKE